jgi:uncharacterized membrane protein
MQERNDYRKTLLAIFLASLAIFTTLAYVATTPRPSEEFFQIYVLGDDHRLEHYYPNDNSTISPHTIVRWYVGATNSMASAQYAILEFKLGNASIPAPNENTATPSSAPILVQYDRVLLQNETWEFPFSWEIVGENQTGSAISLEVNVNGTTIKMPNPITQGGINFRIFIELWVYNPASNSVEFGWETGSQRRAAWLQVWFNATTPALGTA